MTRTASTWAEESSTSAILPHKAWQKLSFLSSIHDANACPLVIVWTLPHTSITEHPAASTRRCPRHRSPPQLNLSLSLSSYMVQVLHQPRAAQIAGKVRGTPSQWVKWSRKKQSGQGREGGHHLRRTPSCPWPGSYKRRPVTASHADAGGAGPRFGQRLWSERWPPS